MSIVLPYPLKEGTSVVGLTTQKRTIFVHDDPDAPISKVYKLKNSDEEFNYPEIQSMIREIFNLMILKEVAPTVKNIDVSPELDVFINLEHYECDFTSFISSWKCTSQMQVNSIILQLGNILNKLIEMNVAHRTLTPNDIVCKVFLNNGALEHIKLALIDFEETINKGLIYSSTINKINNNYALDNGYVDMDKCTKPSGYDEYSIKKIIETFVLALPDQFRQGIINPVIIHNPTISEYDKMVIADYASFCLDPATPYEDCLALNIIVSTLKWQNVEPFPVNAKVIHAIIKYLCQAPGSNANYIK